jgi:hypothetical protein
MKERTKGRASGEGLMGSVEWGAGGTLACCLKVAGAIDELTSSGAGVARRGRHTLPVSLRPPSVRRPLHVTRVLSYYSLGF